MEKSISASLCFVVFTYVCPEYNYEKERRKNDKGEGIIPDANIKAVITIQYTN